VYKRQRGLGDVYKRQPLSPLKQAEFVRRMENSSMLM
jgi:hypothetical protein